MTIVDNTTGSTTTIRLAESSITGTNADIKICTSSTYYGFITGYTPVTGGKYRVPTTLTWTGTDGNTHTHVVELSEYLSNEYIPSYGFKCTLEYCDTNTELTITGYTQHYQYLRHIYMEKLPQSETLESFASKFKTWSQTSGSSSAVSYLSKVNLVLNDGYFFKGDVKGYYYTGSYPYTKKEITFAISDDKTTAVYTGSTTNDYAISYGVCISEINVTDESGTGITITNNIVSSEVNYTYDDTTNKCDIDIKCADGYSFVNPVANYTDATGETKTQSLNIVGNVATCTIYVNNGSEVTLTGSVRLILSVKTDLSNCYYTGKDKVTKGNTYICRIDTNTGYIFKDTNLPYILYADKYGEIGKVYGTLDTTKEICNISFDSSLCGDSYFTITGQAFVNSDITDEYGAINVYKVTKANLNDFASKRYFKDTTETSTEYIVLNSNIDMGDYVFSIKRFYFNVEATLSSNLYCGNYDTGVTAYVPDNTIYKLNFGYVTIQGINNTNTDYKGTLQVFLPFVGIVSLDSNLYGETINLICEVDIVHGKGVYKIQVNDIIIKTFDVDPCKNIIYNVFTDNIPNMMGKLDTSGNVLYGLEPYIISTAYTEIPDLMQSTHQQVTIQDITGFAKFDYTCVNFACLADEQSEIENLLQQGVIL